MITYCTAYFIELPQLRVLEIDTNFNLLNSRGDIYFVDMIWHRPLKVAQRWLWVSVLVSFLTSLKNYSISSSNSLKEHSLSFDHWNNGNVSWKLSCISKRMLLQKERHPNSSSVYNEQGWQNRIFGALEQSHSVL